MVTAPHHTPPHPLNSLTRLLASVTQFRYLLLTFFPFKAVSMQLLLLITDFSLNVRCQFKFKRDGTELPATDVSGRSLCCTINVRLQFQR